MNVYSSFLDECLQNVYSSHCCKKKQNIKTSTDARQVQVQKNGKGVAVVGTNRTES